MTQKIKQSRFWHQLWAYYVHAPSIALCRVPELEYAAGLDLTERTLDHCCGDGYFATLAWPKQKIAAGCDINHHSIRQATGQKIYTSLSQCDAGKVLPYPDAAFDLVFNNSALEHIWDLDKTLAEVARVLAPGGCLAFSVLNHRYFEWWPLSEKAKKGYQAWQPFYHALPLAEWKRPLANVGLELITVEGYFDRQAARDLARLDCAFSGLYLAKRPSQLVTWYQRLPRVMRRYWYQRLAALTWQTEPDSGAGYFIKAVKS